MFFSIRAMLTATAIAVPFALATAQTAPDQDHGAQHHNPPATAKPNSPHDGPSSGMPRMGMGQMMGGNMAQRMAMMSMMRDSMMQGGGMGIMPGDHTEGRIAFYKAELAITDAQLPQWNTFADALRASARGMRTAMSGMMRQNMPATAPARMDVMVQMMSARLDSMKAVQSATKPLYEVLSDEQKKTADELLTERPMGMPMPGMGERGMGERGMGEK